MLINITPCGKHIQTVSRSRLFTGLGIDLGAFLFIQNKNNLDLNLSLRLYYLTGGYSHTRSIATHIEVTRYKLAPHVYSYYKEYKENTYAN